MLLGARVSREPSQAIAGLQSPEPGYLAADIGGYCASRRSSARLGGEDDDPIRCHDAKRAPVEWDATSSRQAVASAADVHAAGFVCRCCLRLSFLPSLLPRAALFQGWLPASARRSGTA